MRKLVIFLLLVVSFQFLSYGQSIKERFKGQDKLIYEVYYNGMFSGHIYWSYKGTEKVEGGLADVIHVSSDTKILGLLDLTSDEDVFLDSENHLPLKVKRNIVMFGKKELIDEIYDQGKGFVRLIIRGDEAREEIISQDKPIHNILALLYFFPQNVKLEKDRWMNFNLPTQKIKIKFIKERPLKTDTGEVDTYFLIGRGAKRFSLWMDKVTRMPLRLEFVSLLGKVSIVRAEENQP
ncbi:MAG: DUF3108 domain-containing protein [Candidatus Omnitrophica bacterium]|nr:DUF3108 domain-containing protein [Candidatus Omnitrophota bacterium]